MKAEEEEEEEEEGWWIMCANLSGSVLFSVTSTQRTSVSSYV